MQYCVLTVQMEKRISYLKEKTNVDCDQNELDHDIIYLFIYFLARSSTLTKNIRGRSGKDNE